MTIQQSETVPNDAEAEEPQVGDVQALGSMWPLRKFRLPLPHAAVIDIIEDDRGGHGPTKDQRDGFGGVHVPTAVVVDGQQFLLPREAKVTMQTSGAQATEVTITLLARRVRVGYWDELDGEIQPPPPSRASRRNPPATGPGPASESQSRRSPV